MIDLAAAVMDNGAFIASERIQGVNDNMFTSHFHTYYELYYLESGERYHLIDDELHHVTANQLLLFEPYVLHRSYGEKNIPFSRILIYFKKEFIHSFNVLNNLEYSTGVYKFKTRENSMIYNFMNHIMEEYSNQGVYSREYLQSLIQLLLITLLKNKDAKSKENFKNRVTSVISYINDNYNFKITLDSLAKEFFISKEHLCREFKFYTNMSIIQYINNVRIMNAQKFMKDSSRNITDISLDVGFGSITHFERVFKSIADITPTQYRKKYIL